MKNPFLTAKYGYCFVFLYVRLFSYERMKVPVVALQSFISNKSRYVTTFFPSCRRYAELKLATDCSNQLKG